MLYSHTLQAVHGLKCHTAGVSTYYILALIFYSVSNNLDGTLYIIFF